MFTLNGDVMTKKKKEKREHRVRKDLYRDFRNLYERYTGHILIITNDDDYYITAEEDENCLDYKELLTIGKTIK